MPERAYRLRSSGASTCTLMSVGRHEGREVSEIFTFYSSFYRTTLSLSPQTSTLLFDVIVCNTHEESTLRLSGRRVPFLKSVLGLVRPMIPH